MSSLVIRDVVKAAANQTINDKSADLPKPTSPLLAHQTESKEEQRSAAAAISNDASIVAAIDDQDQVGSNLK